MKFNVPIYTRLGNNYFERSGLKAEAIASSAEYLKTLQMDFYEIYCANILDEG